MIRVDRSPRASVRTNTRVPTHSRTRRGCSTGLGPGRPPRQPRILKPIIPKRRRRRRGKHSAPPCAALSSSFRSSFLKGGWWIGLRGSSRGSLIIEYKLYFWEIQSDQTGLPVLITAPRPAQLLRNSPRNNLPRSSYDKSA